MGRMCVEYVWETPCAGEGVVRGTICVDGCLCVGVRVRVRVRVRVMCVDGFLCVGVCMRWGYVSVWGRGTCELRKDLSIFGTTGAELGNG